MTDSEALKILEILGKTHKAEITDDLVTLWFNVLLHKLDFKETLFYAKGLAKYFKQFPTPVQFWTVLKGLMGTEVVRPSTEVSQKIAALSLAAARERLSSIEVTYDIRRGDHDMAMSS